MRSRYFILEDRQAIPAAVMTWAIWLERSDNGRIVAKTQVGDSEISTVFLGLDHQFIVGGPPLIFETMVFGGLLDGEEERYSTWEQAEAGHKDVVERVQNT